jgi:hypothetical protein
MIVQFTAEHWTNKDWAIYHQSEGAYVSSKVRNAMINPKARKDYQRQSAIHYALARKHMSIDE